MLVKIVDTFFVADVSNYHHTDSAGDRRVQSAVRRLHGDLCAYLEETGSDFRFRETYLFKITEAHGLFYGARTSLYADEHGDAHWLDVYFPCRGIAPTSHPLTTQDYVAHCRYTFAGLATDVDNALAAFSRQYEVFHSDLESRERARITPLLLETTKLYVLTGDISLDDHSTVGDLRLALKGQQVPVAVYVDQEL
jgi:hypothetical protein